MENNQWKFVFYEPQQGRFLKQYLFNESTVENLSEVVGYRVPTINPDKDDAGFSINDLLCINGESYKINRFDLNVYDCELHICVIHNGSN